MMPKNTILSAICAIFLVLGGSDVADAQEAGSAPRDEAKPQSATTPAVAFSGKIAGDSASTRVFFDFDRPVTFDAFFMDDPVRLVVDGGPILFRFDDLEEMAARGLVRGLQYGSVAAGRSRIVLTLTGPAQAVRREVVEIEPGRKFRLVIDLEPQDAGGFASALAEQQQLRGASGDVAVKGDRVIAGEKKAGRFTIVVDPGHGGIDSGALGKSGTQEKDVTLALARLIAAEIPKLGPFDVVMTREEDVFVSLRERVNIARRNKADLFISVHADSLRQDWVRGASVYTLSTKASDELAHELAQSENMSDIAAGLEGIETGTELGDILADLTARETSRYSSFFSSIVASQLSRSIELIKNPERSASFTVLRAAEVPGVLIELGYLSNAEEEELMNDSKWQQDAAKRVAEAVAEFFRPRM
jgi:N-acetylmuramoyl-L-alanine amidase